MAIWTFWWLWFNFSCVECPVSWAAFPGQRSHAQDEGSQVIETTILCIPNAGLLLFDRIKCMPCPDFPALLGHPRPKWRRRKLFWSWSWKCILPSEMIAVLITSVISFMSRNGSWHRNFVNMCLETAFLVAKLKTNITCCFPSILMLSQ